MAKHIAEERDARGIPDLSLIVRRRHLFTVCEADIYGKSLCAGSNLSEFLKNITFRSGMIIDIDPVVFKT